MNKKKLKRARIQAYPEDYFMDYHPNSKSINLQQRLRTWAGQILPRNLRIPAKKLVSWNIEDGIRYLESQISTEELFINSNKQRYEIHHIKPYYLFNFLPECSDTELLEEFRKYCSLSNLKVVTSKDHRCIHYGLKKSHMCLQGTIEL